MKSVSPCSQDGQTPLHMAASGRLDGDLDGRLACITLLLSYKANMELPDKVLLLNPFMYPSVHSFISIHSFFHSSIHPSNVSPEGQVCTVLGSSLVSTDSAPVGVRWLCFALHGVPMPMVKPSEAQQ